MEDDNKERFLNSFMEISYLTDPDNEYHNYESKKIKTSDIVQKFLPATGHAYTVVHLPG
jgi:hypothetical protein